MHWCRAEEGSAEATSVCSYFGVDSLQELREKLGVKSNKPILTSTHEFLKFYAFVASTWPLIHMVDLPNAYCYKFAWAIFTGYVNLANRCKTKADFLGHFTNEAIVAMVTLSRVLGSVPSGERGGWVDWEVLDGDDVGLHFAVCEKVRLPAIDVPEGGKQNPLALVAARCLQHVKRAGYKARMVKEYGRDRYGRTVATVVLSQPVDFENPIRQICVHKWLVAIGAAYVYPLFLVGETKEEVLELWELQETAKRRSDLVRARVQTLKQQLFAEELKSRFAAAPMGKDLENFQNFLTMREQWRGFNENDGPQKSVPCPDLGGLSERSLDAWFCESVLITVWIPTERVESDGNASLWVHPASWYRDYPFPWASNRNLKDKQRIGYPYLVKLQDRECARTLQRTLSKWTTGGTRHLKTRKKRGPRETSPASKLLPLPLPL